MEVPSDVHVEETGGNGENCASVMLDYVSQMLGAVKLA